MGDPALSKLSSELEDAGLLGGAAASILGFAAFGTSEPGHLVTTATGAVWTKTITNAGNHSADVGIGVLTLNGGSLATTAGFAFEDGDLAEFSLLVSFAGASAATPVSLTLPASVAYLVPAKKDGDKIIGYEVEGPKEAVKLDLPLAGALEISIRRTDEGVQSALTVHGAAASVGAAAQGIFEFDLGDKVLVIEKFLRLGLSIKTLYLDLSSSTATPVSGLFPEVYDPRWKGLGAKSVGMHLPVDDKGTEWVNATLDGFLIGLDGKVSFHGKVEHLDTSPGQKVRKVTGELDVRDNEIIKGAFGAEIDLKSAAEATSTAASGSARPGLSSAQKSILSKVDHDVTEAKSKPAFSLDGNLKCRIQLIRIPVGAEDEIVGLDVTVEAIEEVQGQSAGLVLQGPAARILFWLGLGAGSAALLYTGIDEEDGLKAAGGLGLAMLLIADVGDFVTDSVPQFLPTLDRLEFRRLTFRRVLFPEEGATPAKRLDHIELDVVVSMSVDGTLSDVLGDLAGRGLATAQSFGKLFDKAVDEIEIKGTLELELDNIDIAFETTTDGTEIVTEIDERVRRVAGIKDLQLKARKFPSIELKEAPPQPGGDGFTFPKPILGVEFLSQEQGSDSRYGLALELRGLEHPAFKLESPAVLGLVLYFYPEFDIEFDASLIVEPRLRFVIPYWVLVDGAFEIDKPIPAFDGTQNRIAVDVGLSNTEVPRGTELDKAKLALLNDLSKYKYRFGGEIAWGEAEIGDPTRTYSFLFVEAHYEGASPFIVIGPVGIYGLAGLFGRNIAPGMPGDARDATAIANWIEGDAQSFDNILEWPSPPSTSGWHPDRDFDDDEDLYVAGLKVRAGEAGARTVDVDALLMLGFNEFWLASAGRVTVKVVNLGATAIVVYDSPSKSFAIRIRFELKIDAGGEEILSVAGPIEISSGSSGFRVAIGHYRPDRGGPLVARLFKDLFRAQLYGVYDSGPQDDFGFALPGMDARPDLIAGSFSHGVLFQYGPKKIGPSAVHIRIHAGAGYNIGLSDDPFILVGELFLSGGLHLKVLFVKVGFTLTAFLAGRLTSECFDFRGRIVVEIGMPWPLPDIDVPVPLGFHIGSGDIPEPDVSSTISTMSHAVPKATEVAAGAVPVVPIDTVIGLRFNKPIAGVTQGPGTQTTLVDITPVNPQADGGSFSAAYKDIVETKLLQETYTIEFLHFLTDVRVTRRPVAGGASVTVTSMKAAWDAPAVFDSGSGGASDPGHRAIYFNTLLQPELSAHPEKLGTFIEGQITNGVLPPCEKPDRFCMMAGGAPDISEGPNGLRTATRATQYGPITVGETRLPSFPSPIVIENRVRLGWSGSALRLPGEVQIDVPAAARVTAELELRTIVSQLVGTIGIEYDVSLAGPLSPVRLVMWIDVAQTPCGLELKTELIPDDEARVKVDATVRSCADRGVMVIAVEIAALQHHVHLSRLKLRGPSVLPPGFGPSLGGAPFDVGSWLKTTREIPDGPELHLDDLCFETIEASHDAWETEVQTFGSGVPSDASIEQFAGTMLLEPDHDYEIRYRVLSDAKTVTDGDGSDAIDAERQFTKDSGTNEELRTIRFRTASEPTRDIAPYVGFVYPAAGLTPVYADQTVPVVSFRDNGLIKRIYRAHRGADVLMPVIRNAAGQKLDIRATRSLSVSSSAAGDVMEGLIAPCLGEAQGFTRIEVDVFERRLEPNTRYALSVEDTSLAQATDLPPYRSAFRTSRYKTFAAHLAAANALTAVPVEVPIVGPDPTQILASIFADVASGTLAGYDDLVEAIYRRALAHETGRLALEFGTGGDVAAQMVAQTPQGTVTAFGFALELAEPLLGKDGVGFGGTAIDPPVALRNKGIALQQTGSQVLTTVRDRSGSRLLVFRSADASTFTPALSPIQLPLAFDGGKAVRAAVTDYVERNFAALGAADRANRLQAIMTDLASKPEMAGGLVTDSGDLVLPPAGGG